MNDRCHDYGVARTEFEDGVQRAWRLWSLRLKKTLTNLIAEGGGGEVEGTLYASKSSTE